MSNNIAKILANAERLRALQKAARDAIPRDPYDCSKAEYAAARDALETWYREYDRLFYPGGGGRMDALRDCEDEAVSTALDYLEADPRYFRSGYWKEWIWKHISQCPLTPAQIVRLEDIALAYTRRRMEREFAYMCRAMSRVAGPEFWDTVRTLARRWEGSPTGLRLTCLAAYAEGSEAGEKARQQFLWRVKGS